MHLCTSVPHSVELVRHVVFRIDIVQLSELFLVQHRPHRINHTFKVQVSMARLVPELGTVDRKVKSLKLDGHSTPLAVPLLGQ